MPRKRERRNRGREWVEAMPPTPLTVARISAGVRSGGEDAADGAPGERVVPGVPVETGGSMGPVRIGAGVGAVDPI